jgi:PAS domain S-box-containing protein
MADQIRRRHELEELIDVPRLQDLTDRLYEAAGIPSAIITTTGKILTGSGWQRICTDFHRMHREIERMCIASDTALHERMEEGDPFAMYTCPFGLTDASTPIVIDGEHLANAFAGQLFLTPPDDGVERRFRDQARRYGLDEASYIEAFREVPVIPLERFRPMLDSLRGLAEMIAAIGLQRKREMEAQERLRDTEALLSAIGNNLPDAYVFQYTHDELGRPRFLFVSEGVERVHGISAEEALSVPMALHGQVVPEDLPALIEDEIQSGTHMTDFARDVRFRSPSGEKRWIHIRSRPRRVDDGRVVWDGVATDVTGQRRADEVLHASEERFRAMVERSGDAVALVSATGELLYASPNSPRVTGHAPGSQIGHDVFATIHPEDRQMVQEAFRSVLENGSGAQGTLRFRALRPDGSVWWADGQAVNLLSHPNVGAIVVNYRDVTQRVSAEEALRVREEIFSSIVGQAADGIVLVDAETGRFVEFNEAAHCELGYTREEFGRLTLADISEHSAQDLADTFASLRGGASASFQTRHRAKDGSWRDVHVRTRGLELRGRFCAAAVWTDITERLRAEHALRHAQKMESVGRLAGGVAHDFNNLLTGILGNLSLALEDVPEGEPLALTLREAADAATSAADLTRRLLTFSRKQIVEPRILDINEVIRHSEKMLRRLIGEDVVLKSVLEETAGSVRADPGQLEQILVNLAVNARDAMPRGGWLTLRTATVTLDEAFCRAHPHASPGRFVQVSVEDDGEGMSDDAKAHLFEPFYTTKSVGRGTGLGLPMVYGAVKQNAGYIDVQSEAGQGTTVRIYLPHVEAAPEASPSAGREDLPRGDETILLVEDEELVRGLARRVLEHQGYTVVACSEGLEALTALRSSSGHVHLLLTDVVMPGMDGKELADRSLEIRPDLKVLFSSGYAKDVLGRHGVLDEEEGVAFIAKPYTPGALARKVRAVLDGTS